MRVLVAALVLAAPATAQDLDCSDWRSLPQQPMNACLAQFYALADTRLNTAYQAALASLSYDAGEQELLRVAQRAWIPFRDAACEVEAGYMRGGSGEPMMRFLCLRRITEQRTADLEAMVRN